MPGWSMPFCPFRLYAVFTPHHANPLATAHFSLWKYQSRTEALPGLQYLLLRRFLSRGGHRFCLVFNGSVPQLPWTSKFGVKTGDFLWDECLAWDTDTSAEALRHATSATGSTTLHQRANGTVECRAFKHRNHDLMARDQPLPELQVGIPGAGLEPDRGRCTVNHR